MERPRSKEGFRITRDMLAYDGDVLAALADAQALVENETRRWLESDEPRSKEGFDRHPLPKENDHGKPS